MELVQSVLLNHTYTVCNDARQGHVFLYDVDKGGSENWGLTEIIEGDPDQNLVRLFQYTENIWWVHWCI